MNIIQHSTTMKQTFSLCNCALGTDTYTCTYTMVLKLQFRFVPNNIHKYVRYSHTHRLNRFPEPLFISDFRIVCFKKKSVEMSFPPFLL